MPPRNKTVEQQQVEDAPIVEAPPAPETTPVDPDDALEAAVTALMAEQFGGEDNEPQEGVARWDDMVREMAVEADRLETEYRTILKKKEDNRTLLRAFVGMKKLPAEISRYYYPERKRLTKAEKAAKDAAAAAATTTTR